MSNIPDHGVILDNGSVITHSSKAVAKNPFTTFKVPVREFSQGTTDLRPAYRGQSGLIEFNTSTRLPRHVHISNSRDSTGNPVLLHERIYVVGGVALVELAGEIYVIPPRCLVTIAPGVPHTWTACVEGVNIPNGDTPAHEGDCVTSEGKFTMLYEYEEITGFLPTAQTERLSGVQDYVKCNDLESIRIPALNAEQVKKRCWFVQNGCVCRAETL